MQHAVAQQSADDRSAEDVVVVQLYAAHGRKLLPFDRGVVILQIPLILRIDPIDAADRAHSQPEQIGAGLRRVALEIPVQRPVVLGHAQLVSGRAK